MTLADLRSRYGVPAFKGSKVQITDSSGTLTEAVIIGSARGGLKVKLELTGQIRLCHPTYCIKYL
jgi:hypothetical protein